MNGFPNLLNRFARREMNIFRIFIRLIILDLAPILSNSGIIMKNCEKLCIINSAINKLSMRKTVISDRTTKHGEEIC